MAEGWLFVKVWSIHNFFPSNIYHGKRWACGVDRFSKTQEWCGHKEDGVVKKITKIHHTNQINIDGSLQPVWHLPLQYLSANQQRAPCFS